MLSMNNINLNNGLTRVIFLDMETASEMAFLVRLSVPIGRLLQHYSECVDRPLRSLTFRYFGMPIEPNETPLSMQIIYNDVIEVYTVRPRGNGAGRA